MSNLYCKITASESGKSTLEVNVQVDEVCWKYSRDKKEMLREILRKAVDQIVDELKE